ncbi:MAG: GDSL-type esterase/lipase family protein [Bacteroidota bacterium]
MWHRILSLLAFLFISFPLLAQVVIHPCGQAQAQHIVVLGSSTAAGTGPSSPDSTWVNRYRAYLQQVNPQNQVTNLAVGGTTTYHIMPDWFSPPAGRPSPTPTKNVSEAISLGADAIIVNMPSNDAANNFGVGEQLFNFQTIVAVADSVGIPVWVCTTQPRNGFSTSQKAIQTAVRDSVFAIFGMKALDFWKGFADNSNQLLTAYDSGDGVHMNDAAHKILFERVQQAALPNELADTLAVTDHYISQLLLDPFPVCGDSQTVIRLGFANLGVSSNATFPLDLHITDLNTGTQQIQTLNSMSPLAACQSDTLLLTLDTYQGVNLSIQAVLNAGDQDQSNDTSATLFVETPGHPELALFPDTVCAGENAMLGIQSNLAADHLFWYDSPVGGNKLGEGPFWSLDSLWQNQSLYAQAIRGNLYFDASVSTSNTTNKNWNGVMFNLIAHDSLILDSMRVKMNSTGPQQMVLYFRQGGYQGAENSPAAWTMWDTVVVNASQAGERVMMYPASKSLSAEDTLGVYMHLLNGGATLSYADLSQLSSVQDSVLEIRSGAGITHTFGTIYTPRMWSGEVFYHHGYRPEGDCASPRMEVRAVVSQPSLDLGKDTFVHAIDPWLLQAPETFAAYLWSTGDTTAFLLIDSSRFDIGVPYTIWLEATDRWGCTVRDSLQMELYVESSIGEIGEAPFHLFPNPGKDQIEIMGLTGRSLFASYLVINSQGQQVQSGKLRQGLFPITSLPAGIYVVLLQVAGKGYPIRFEKSPG